MTDFPDRECVEHLAAAAASLIERLTAENAKAEAERDAALADLADARSCKTCKYAWEWRGLPGAPEEGGKHE